MTVADPRGWGSGWAPAGGTSDVLNSVEERCFLWWLGCLKYDWGSGHHRFGNMEVGFRLINQPAMGVPPWLWKPPYEIISVVVVMKVPLVNQHNYGKSPIFNGESTINGPFPITMLITSGTFAQLSRWLAVQGEDFPSLPSQKRLKRWRVTRGAVADGESSQPWKFGKWISQSYIRWDKYLISTYYNTRQEFYDIHFSILKPLDAFLLRARVFELLLRPRSEIIGANCRFLNQGCRCLSRKPKT